MARNTEPGMGKPKGVTSGSGRTTRYNSVPTGKPARWGDVDGGRLTDMLDALQSAGDAALLGASRDGMVLVLTVCSGDERTKFYAKTAEEMDVHVAAVEASALSLSGASR